MRQMTSDWKHTHRREKGKASVIERSFPPTKRVQQSPKTAKELMTSAAIRGKMAVTMEH